MSGKTKKQFYKLGLAGNVASLLMFLSNVFTQIFVNNVQAEMPAPRQTGDIFPQAYSQCCNKQLLNIWQFSSLGNCHFDKRYLQ